MLPIRSPYARARATTISMFLIAATACGSGEAGSQPGPAPTGDESATGARQFELTAVAPDVYQARGVGDLVVGANAGIVINEEDVMLVDSHISPAAANALLEELRTLTDKPVRYVANTHWHFDHAHGNQVYPSDVEIISHEETRAAIAAGRSKSGRSYDLFIGSIPARIAEMEATLDTLRDADARAELEETLEGQRTFYAQVQEVVPTPPNTTLSDRMTLYRGGREIEFLFFGRGHTDGDVVVYLPGDRVLFSGDLITAGLPYMGDGYVDEWVETLQHIKSLDFDWVVPGHGAAFEDPDKVRIGYLQDYLRDLWSQATQLHEKGATAEEAAAAIDLSAHADHFEGISGPGVNPVTVIRIFDLLDGTAS